MSKVAISGNASGTGTFTIAAPNSNTDRTLTLPDEAGTVVVTDGTTLFVDNTNDRVGIGTSSINATYAPHLQVESTTNDGTGGLLIGSYLPTLTLIDYSGGAGASQIQQDNTNFLIKNGGTERARIDSSGNLLVGTTARNYNDNAPGSKFSYSGLWLSGVSQVSGANMYLNQYNASGTTYLAYFMYNGAIKGSISSNGSTTAYNTTSDYRLKEDWIPVVDASTRVKTLKPCNFAWKESGTRTDGFLAHELAEVIPDAVSGEKDAVDAEGNPVYQGIDQSKLVPLLTAALQEALTRIETLEADVAALKGTA